jgi:hypothetical protein
VCSKFSGEGILFILKNLLSTLPTKKSIERNLLIKKFIKEIIYSKENIKICFYYEKNLKNFVSEKSPTHLMASGAGISSERKENSISSNKSRFATEAASAQIKLPQTFTIILPNLIHKSKEKNLNK